MVFSYCSDSFNEQYSAAQLLALWRVYNENECAVFPDQWAPRQVAEALEGRAPKWDDELRAVYT